MRGYGILAALLCGSLGAGAASAEGEWSGKAMLGGVLARGNTETETINADFDVEYKTAPWTHSFGGSLLRTVANDITSADRWELRAQSNYDLTERSYLFGKLRYEDDSFTDFSYQATATTGYGYRFIMTETTKLDGEIGAGVRRTELRITGETQEDAIARAAINYEHKLTSTTLIYDRFLVESGSENTFLQNQLGVQVKINETFALGVDYAVRHNTEVLLGTDKTDQVLTVNLVYGF